MRSGSCPTFAAVVSALIVGGLSSVFASCSDGWGLVRGGASADSLVIELRMAFFVLAIECLPSLASERPCMTSM
ncbi:hypothetical protein PR003_g557 [Phytophthora rubi]|uniref:RxLR effector protein n=1 Tax=Phytophthora rubi TaxID=129364 RepID=A0A6A3PIM7_9STRA|nr:hypothetical protein PR002_g822 [Phytophthora rubi]KAE9052558.1 hypothetical protein PR001_g410 [Phytophthora rubi]KAE9359813.1 hypothetical protein PR003_g557 [Phytophthora rubi]